MMCKDCLAGHRLYCFFDKDRVVPVLELPRIRRVYRMVD